MPCWNSLRASIRRLRPSAGFIFLECGSTRLASIAPFFFMSLFFSGDFFFMHAYIYIYMCPFSLLLAPAISLASHGLMEHLLDVQDVFP